MADKASLYVKDLSDVTITFTDGEMKTYRISAGPSIGGYLAREAGASGVLSLFNRDQSWGVPLSGIRDWSILPVPVPESVDQSNG